MACSLWAPEEKAVRHARCGHPSDFCHLLSAVDLEPKITVSHLVAAAPAPSVAAAAGVVAGAAAAAGATEEETAASAAAEVSHDLIGWFVCARPRFALYVGIDPFIGRPILHIFPGMMGSSLNVRF